MEPKTTYRYCKRGKIEWIIALLGIITVDVSIDIVAKIALLPHLIIINLLFFGRGERDYGLYSIKLAKRSSDVQGQKWHMPHMPTNDELRIA